MSATSLGTLSKKVLEGIKLKSGGIWAQKRRAAIRSCEPQLPLASRSFGVLWLQSRLETSKFCLGTRTELSFDRAEQLGSSPSQARGDLALLMTKEVSGELNAFSDLLK